VDEKARVQKVRALKIAGDARRAQRRAHDDSRSAHHAEFAQIEEFEADRLDPIPTGGQSASVSLTDDIPIDLTGDSLE
jgi:hypothetical protein